MLLCQGTVLNVSSIPSRPDYILYPPVTSSLTSASIDFLNSRSKAGIPPTFFIAILFSSVDLPNTRFRRAPQAFFWTSKTLWSKRSTRCLIPPSLYTWNEKNPRPEGYAVNWWLHKSVRVRSWDRHTCWKFEGYSLRWRSFPVLRLKEKGDLGDRPLHTGQSHTRGLHPHQAWHFHCMSVWSEYTDAAPRHSEPMQESSSRPASSGYSLHTLFHLEFFSILLYYSCPPLGLRLLCGFTDWAGNKCHYRIRPEMLKKKKICMLQNTSQ